MVTAIRLAALPARMRDEMAEQDDVSSTTPRHARAGKESRTGCAQIPSLRVVHRRVGAER
jgi:hypothetical protein